MSGRVRVWTGRLDQAVGQAGWTGSSWTGWLGLGQADSGRTDRVWTGQLSSAGRGKRRWTGNCSDLPEYRPSSANAGPPAPGCTHSSRPWISLPGTRPLSTRSDLLDLQKLVRSIEDRVFPRGTPDRTANAPPWTKRHLDRRTSTPGLRIEGCPVGSGRLSGAATGTARRSLTSDGHPRTIIGLGLNPFPFRFGFRPMWVGPGADERIRKSPAPRRKQEDACLNA